MKDIARIAGVSLGTVSHVLKNTANVRATLRKRVLDAVKTEGYQPSQLARGLRRDKTNVIGMVIPDITSPFSPALFAARRTLRFRTVTGCCSAMPMIMPRNASEGTAHLPALGAHRDTVQLQLPDNSG